MLRLIGSFLIIISGTLGGLYLSDRIIQRERFYSEFIEFLTELYSQMKYSEASLERLFESIDSGEMLKKIIRDCSYESDEALPFKELWKKSVLRIPKEYGINQEDKKLLTSFGNSLGTTDIEGQLKHISLHIELAAAKHGQAVKNSEKKVKLYRMLGVFSGICAALLII